MIVYRKKGREVSFQKSLYISERLAKRVEQVSIRHDTSFNHIIISMIEYCLEEEDAAYRNNISPEPEKQTLGNE